tara:strand:+ start:935 stop:2059 length:1125 start_codon:yes stop_codon:yes gene_type:complete
MATSFKNFLNNDVTSTRTLLHEAIPITGSIVSGTYNDPSLPILGPTNSENNIKNYSHGLFQSVFDYPHLSSSANHIFDVTVGYSNTSTLSASSNVQNADKINIYSQMAQLLVGHDVNGNIQDFDADGNLTGDDKLKECIFINFARLLQKDEIKKGSFNMVVGDNTSYGAPFFKGLSGTTPLPGISITDTNAQNSYKVNSPAGEYAVLFGSGSTTPNTSKVGLLYYQAGIAVLTASVFLGSSTDSANGLVTGTVGYLVDASTVNSSLTSQTISGSSVGLRNRIYDIDFNNSTELNSTIYFCRAGHNEFNYSSNPTYVDSTSQIRVKNSSLDQPVSYITTVGLYSADNELLAVAKVSEPLKKTPDTELTLRVRLDY